MSEQAAHTQERLNALVDSLRAQTIADTQSFQERQSELCSSRDHLQIEVIRFKGEMERNQEQLQSQLEELHALREQVTRLTAQLAKENRQRLDLDQQLSKLSLLHENVTSEFSKVCIS